MDRNLLGLGPFANVNLVASRGSVDGILDVSEPCIGTFNFVVIDDQPSVVGGQRVRRTRNGGPEKYSQRKQV